MPEFYARARNAQGSYATIKKDGTLGWTHKGGAMAFASPEAAKAAVEASLRLTFEKAAKAAKPPSAARGAWHDYPDWMHGALDFNKGGNPKLRPDALGSLCRVDCKASIEDVMGAFELFYARGPRGWLGGPRTKAGWGSFEWRESFSEAAGFASREALLDALAAAPHGDACSIVKSSCAMTGIERVGKFVDDGSSALASAIDARDIESAIKGAAEGRLDAMEAAGTPRARRPGGRL